MRRRGAALLPALLLPAGSAAVNMCGYSCIEADNKWQDYGCWVNGDRSQVRFCDGRDMAPSWCAGPDQPARCRGCGGEWCEWFPCKGDGSVTCAPPSAGETNPPVTAPPTEAEGTPATPPPTVPPTPPLGDCHERATEDECRASATHNCVWKKMPADGSEVPQFQCKPRCAAGTFGEGCTVTCDAATTCGGKGVCGSKGKCKCDKGWMGPDCSTQGKPSCRCSAWGDPHYSDWSGWPFEFHGRGAYDIYSRGEFHVTAEHAGCGAGSGGMQCQKRVNIWHENWGDTSVEMYRNGAMFIGCDNKVACAPRNGMKPNGQWGVVDSCPNSRATVDAALAALDPPLRLTTFAPAGGEWAPSKYGFVFGAQGSEEARVDVEIPTGKWAMDAYITHLGTCSTSQGAQGWGGVATTPAGVTGLCNGPRHPPLKGCNPMNPGACGPKVLKGRTGLCNYDADSAAPTAAVAPPAPVTAPPVTPPPTEELTAEPTAPAVPPTYCPEECMVTMCEVECEGLPPIEPRTCTDPAEGGAITVDMNKFEPCCAGFLFSGSGCGGDTSDPDPEKMDFYRQCLRDNCISGDPWPATDGDGDGKPLECLASVSNAAKKNENCPCEGNYAFEFETDDGAVSPSPQCPEPGSGECKRGWFGATCTVPCADDTKDSKCSGHGTCDGDGVCVCKDGWTSYEFEEFYQCNQPPPGEPDPPCQPFSPRTAHVHEWGCYNDPEFGTQKCEVDVIVKGVGCAPGCADDCSDECIDGTFSLVQKTRMIEPGVEEDITCNEAQGREILANYIPAVARGAGYRSAKILGVPHSLYGLQVCYQPVAPPADGDSPPTQLDKIRARPCGVELESSEFHCNNYEDICELESAAPTSAAPTEAATDPCDPCGAERQCKFNGGACRSGNLWLGCLDQGKVCDACNPSLLDESETPSFACIDVPGGVVEDTNEPTKATASVEDTNEPTKATASPVTKAPLEGDTTHAPETKAPSTKAPLSDGETHAPVTSPPTDKATKSPIPGCATQLCTAVCASKKNEEKCVARKTEQAVKVIMKYILGKEVNEDRFNDALRIVLQAVGIKLQWLAVMASKVFTNDDNAARHLGALQETNAKKTEISIAATIPAGETVADANDQATKDWLTEQLTDAVNNPIMDEYDVQGVEDVTMSSAPPPPATEEDEGLSSGAIAGIVVGVVALLGIGGLVAMSVMKKRQAPQFSNEYSSDLKDLEDDNAKATGAAPFSGPKWNETASSSPQLTGQRSGQLQPSGSKKGLAPQEGEVDL